MAKKKVDLKKEIKLCDWIVGITIFMMIGIRFFSITYFSLIATETGAEIEAIHGVYEANPLAEMVFNLGKMGYILEMGIIPGMVFASYFLFRRKALKGKVDLDSLYYFVVFIFFFSLMNFVNDAAAMVGKLI